jgi:transcriptional regulator with XRE-family HTH domain
MIKIGRTIKRLRLDRRISQHDLAVAADVTPSFLSLVENDRRQPSLTVIARLAKALSVPEELLIWDAVELPESLGEKDRRLCEMAKLIVRKLYASEYAKPSTDTT